MALINPYKRHLKWESTGRTYEKLDAEGQPTGEKIWAGQIGEQQVQDDQGNWQPYIHENDELRFSHHDSRIKFESGQQVLKKVADKICESVKLFVEKETAPGVWETQPHGLPTRNILHNKRFKNKEIVDYEGSAIGWLEFPDAPYDLQIGMQVGRRKHSVFGFRFRAPISGRVRFQIVKDGIPKVAGGAKLIKRTINDEERILGVQYKDWYWKWTYDEAAYHSIDVQNSSAYPGTWKAVITIGPFDYEENTWIEVVPATWGPTDTSDDCYEDARTTFREDIGAYNDLVQGYNYAYMESGWIWSNVQASGTAGDGCYIEIYVRTLGSGSNGNEYGRLYAVDARDVTAWSQDYRPYTHTTRHATYVAWNVGATGLQKNSSIKTLIQERFDDDHVAGDEIGLVWLETSHSGFKDRIYYNSEDTGSGDPPALYIVYTAGSSSSSSSFSSSSSSSSPSSSSSSSSLSSSSSSSSLSSSSSSSSPSSSSSSSSPSSSSSSSSLSSSSSSSSPSSSSSSSSPSSSSSSSSPSSSSSSSSPSSSSSSPSSSSSSPSSSSSSSSPSSSSSSSSLSSSSSSSSPSSSSSSLSSSSSSSSPSSSSSSSSLSSSSSSSSFSSSSSSLSSSSSSSSPSSSSSSSSESLSSSSSSSSLSSSSSSSSPSSSSSSSSNPSSSSSSSSESSSSSSSSPSSSSSSSSMSALEILYFGVANP